MSTQKPSTIDEYIADFPDDTQKKLEQIRATIKSAARNAGEKISYGIPCITMNEKYLLYFAGYKKHIGLYPVPPASKGFEKDYEPYVTSGKGTIQFPLDKPLPLALIKKITKFRIQDNAAKQKVKPTKRSKKTTAKRR